MSSKPKAKAGSSRGDRDRDRAKESSTKAGQTKDSVKNLDPRKQGRDEGKPKQEQKGSKAAVEAGSSVARPSGTSKDRVSRDKAQDSSRAGSDEGGIGGKGKGKVGASGRPSKATDARSSSMLSTYASSGAGDAFERLTLGGGSGPPLASRSGKKFGNEGPNRNPGSNKGGSGPRARHHVGGISGPGNVPLRRGSKTFTNLDPAACILSNSGLSTELRQKIYGYMLDHRVVRYDPRDPPSQPRPPLRMPHSKDYFECEGSAPAYDFSFELFLCNKKTKADAKAYFDCMNKFVLVEHSMPDFKLWLHEHQVPIVTDSDRLRTYNGHAVYVKLVWDRPPLEVDDQGMPLPDSQTPDQGQILMVSEDFDKFCFMIKWFCLYTVPPAVYITSGRYNTLELCAVTLDNSPRVTFRISRPEVLRSTQREKLFEQLKQIIGGGHGLNITSRDDSDPIATAQSIQSARQVMAPPLIWLYAWNQNMPESALKVRAEALDGECDVHQLYCRFKRAFLLFVQVRRDVLRRLVDPRDLLSSNPEFRQTHLGCYALEFYLKLEFAALLICEREMETGFDAMEVVRCILQRIGDLPNLPDLPSEMRLLHCHVHMLAHLVENEDKMLSEVTSLLRAKVQDMRDIPQHYPQAVHDLEILVPLLDETNESLENPLVRAVLDQMALFKEGLWGFDIPTVFGYLPVGGLAQWQDEIGLALLTDADKEAILTMQRDNGLALSQF